MKPFWRTNRVNQLTEGNLSGYLRLLNQQNGQKYASLTKAADLLFNKKKPGKYFGQIITNINLLGLIHKNPDGTFNLSKLGKMLLEKPNLKKLFFEYFLTKFQFPKPQISEDKTLPTIKPFIVILQILVGLYEQRGNREAYFTQEEFAYFFGESGIYRKLLIEKRVAPESFVINEIIAGREKKMRYEVESNLSGKLSYDKALLLNSPLLSSDFINYSANSSSFFIGLNKSRKDLYTAKFLIKNYTNPIFRFNPNVSYNDKINNDWSEYICNIKDFFEYMNVMNMIDSLIPFREYTKNNGFYFEDDLIRRFMFSLLSKKYLILTGISGSGKSKIAELYGKYLQTQGKGKFLVKAVGSNWNDNKNLLGYINPLLENEDERYQKTDIVDFIREANQNPDKTYILLLDEMNLSYTERYFSDFLSALETLDKKITLPNGKEILWSDNLKIIGTINEDETTHTLSPKVIDRANILEMNGSSPSEYFTLLAEREDRRVQSWSAQEWFEIYKDLLDKIYTAAKGRFGYRVMNEITNYVELNWNADSSVDVKKYIDEQIYQKILPKIHGAKADVKDILDQMEITAEAEELTLSLKKIQEMKSRLKNSGFTSFVNS